MPDSALSEQAVGGILLCGSLIVLLLSIFLLVKVLQDLFKGAAARAICKVINADFPKYLGWLTGYVAMVIGIVFTVLIQSSSVFTSILTPLVGTGLITVERMYPLTLGANLGTTFTSMLAALTNEGEGLKDALQMAFVHLMFNAFGIAIWYPIPLLRRAPIWLAKFLGNTTAIYRWFPIFYLVFMFLIFPLFVFALSLGGPPVLFGVLIPIICFIIFLVVINVIQRKRPQWLPEKFRNWDWIPLWMHSLEPYDQCMVGCCTCKCCRKYCHKGADAEGGNVGGDWDEVIDDSVCEKAANDIETGAKEGTGEYEIVQEHVSQKDAETNRDKDERSKSSTDGSGAVSQKDDVKDTQKVARTRVDRIQVVTSQ